MNTIIIHNQAIWMRRLLRSFFETKNNSNTIKIKFYKGKINFGFKLDVYYGEDPTILKYFCLFLPYPKLTTYGSYQRAI